MHDDFLGLLVEAAHSLCFMRLMEVALDFNFLNDLLPCYLALGFPDSLSLPPPVLVLVIFFPLLPLRHLDILLVYLLGNLVISRFATVLDPKPRLALSKLPGAQALIRCFISRVYKAKFTFFLIIRFLLDNFCGSFEVHERL